MALSLGCGAGIGHRAPPWCAALPGRDRISEQQDAYGFAHVLVTDLADTEGAHSSNVEHRATPAHLEPCTGWAMGNTGMVRALLRFARLHDHGFGPGFG
ncbi:MULTISPECIES: hypothetical protein [unclassified Streptomyces]|uniref:hypothetical protein n=1 Tax=unclassified Streptomyces TaxID=2593676 RepID=UPI003412C367